MKESKLHFDPDLYPDNILKEFTDFAETFELHYTAQYSDRPTASMDNAFEKWKISKLIKN